MFANPYPMDKPRSFSSPMAVAAVLLLLWGTLLSSAHAETRCLTDDLGRRVCVPPQVKRVISFAPSLTEIVFSLGAGHLLVGRTQRCNRPPEALAVPVIGAYLKPDMERVMSSKPDVVLTTKSGATRELVDRLERMGIPVFVAYSKNLDDMLELVVKIGKLLDREKRARALVGKLRRIRRSLHEQVRGASKPTVLFVVGLRPLIVAGGKSFPGALIREAGGINVAEDAAAPYPRYSMEEVLKRDPDLILVFNKECKDKKEFIQYWHPYSFLSALKRGRVHLLDADIMARPAPALVEGMQTLARIFHPQIFAKASRSAPASGKSQ